MTPRNFISLIVILAVSALSGCGGGDGGGGAGAGDVGSVTLTATKRVALADGSDTTSVRAEVKKSDGTAVADGTSVAFSAADSGGTISTSTVVTTNGIASFSVTHAPISGASKQTVTITAQAGGASDTEDVKFISQPANADVFIAFDQAVTNLAGLDFRLNNTSGATFSNTDPQPVFAMNNAAVGSTFVLGNFNPTGNSTRIVLANPVGFNTGTAPIIKATFAVSSGLPLFSADLLSAGSFTATDFNGFAVTPAVTAANLVVTVTYDTEL